VDPEDRNFKIWQPRVDLDRSGITQKLGGDLTAVEVLAYGVVAVREAREEAKYFLCLPIGLVRSSTEKELLPPIPL